jgi:hypothetical protein
MKFRLKHPLITAILSTIAVGQSTPIPDAGRQIAAAVLPLPPVMGEKATVFGYAPDQTLVKLRDGSNGMVCTASLPGGETFDARCYHESFMPVIRRLRELYGRDLPQEEVYRTIDAEVKSGKLVLPDHPTAGYRMLGPMSAYDPATNKAGKEISSWQSIHFPYKTAAELGLPEEGQVPRTIPYVMESGTFWAHVMIEHEQ